jgi:hypothetical protein
VTHKINGRTLIDLATDHFRQTPVVWGRYFTSAATSGLVEYRTLCENQALRTHGIRVMPIARQTKHVGGSENQAVADARDNAEDLILAFGADYLRTQGGKFLMFLDVEGAPSLSEPYYRGWAKTIVDHSSVFSGGAATILPGVYATQATIRLGVHWRRRRQAECPAPKMRVASRYAGRLRHEGVAKPSFCSLR